MTRTDPLERIPSPEECPTIAIPDAGWLAFRLSKAASYRAADNGTLPTIAVGPNRRRVPTAALRQMLGLDA
jgi:hypothetical protein